MSLFNLRIDWNEYKELDTSFVLSIKQCLHVHLCVCKCVLPLAVVSVMTVGMGMIPKSQVGPEQVESYMAQERGKRRELLHKFLQTCSACKVLYSTNTMELYTRTFYIFTKKVNQEITKVLNRSKWTPSWLKVIWLQRLSWTWYPFFK